MMRTFNLAEKLAVSQIEFRLCEDSVEKVEHLYLGTEFVGRDFKHAGTAKIDFKCQ